MSRSTIIKKELLNGDHLVCITKAVKEGNEILVTFASGKNEQFEELYDFNSSEFIKMCHSAGTIKDKEVFNSLDCIGKTLWITIKLSDITSTHQHIEGLEAIPFKDIIESLPEVEGSRRPFNIEDFPGKYKNNMSIMPEGPELNVTGSQIKAKETILKEAREMIKAVESGASKKESDDYKWEELPKPLDINEDDSI